MRKARPSSPAAASESPEALLITELLDLARGLPEEGLRFLIDQARVLRYNQDVVRVADGEEHDADSHPRPGADGAGATEPLRVEASEDRKTYHLVVKGQYKLFDAPEMLALVRLAYGCPKEGEAKKALYAWFRRERGDALSDFGIPDHASPLLGELVRTLRSSFRKPGS